MGDPTTTATTPILQPRTLYAFDFDHTILDGNSDTEVINVTDTPLPQEVKDSYDGTNWTVFMNNVFAFLHQNGVTVDQIQDFVRKMNPTPGMVSLLQEIQATKFLTDSKLLIISDANDIFITGFLTSIGVVADDVITNRATILPSGQIQLEPFENQESCLICPRNLCKGSAILQYLNKEKTVFSSIVYVGDGRNDVCPGIKLSSSDFLFARRGYGLEKIIKRGKVQGRKTRQSGSKDGQENEEVIEIDLDIKAQIHFWDDAETIRNVIFPGAKTDD